MRQSLDKTSRVLRLVVCLGLIGGVGCFTGRSPTPEQLRAERQAAVEAFEKLQRDAAAGDLSATTRLGIDYVSGNLVTFQMGLEYTSRNFINRDVAKGIALLELAVAKHYGPAENTLGWLYLGGRTANSGYIVVSPDLMPRQPQRGLELLKQSASYGCTPAPIAPYEQTENMIGSLYRAGSLVERDTAQADLWLARSLLHCKTPNAQFVANIYLQPSATTPESRIEAMALLLLMPPSDASSRLQSTLSPEDMQAAQDKMAGLRRAVADSEKQYPAPPPPGKS